MIRVRAVLIGKLAPLGQRAILSGIDKRVQNKPIQLRRNGIVGDQHGDRKHHGGLEKAVHHYPFEHYVYWRGQLPCAFASAKEGAFGENLSTSGMTEAAVSIGDVYRVGSTLVQVSQGRQPCWRLNERFGNSAVAHLVQRSGRTGWYYRVLEEGMMSTGDEICLVDRPAPDWTLESIQHILYRDVLNVDRLAELARLPEISDSWRSVVLRRLERRTVEVGRSASQRRDPQLC